MSDMNKLTQELYDGLSDKTKSIMEKYTKKIPYEMTDYPDAHKIILMVDHQSFQVNEYCEDANHADWMRIQLSTALSRMVHTENEL